MTCSKLPDSAQSKKSLNFIPASLLAVVNDPLMSVLLNRFLEILDVTSLLDFSLLVTA